jgi:hypothetical protein
MNRRPSIQAATIASVAMLLVACRPSDAERNVILGTSPFFTASTPYREADTERVISSVRTFAAANGMEFLLAQESLERGDFNAHANTRNLNLQVLHVKAISPETIEISAIARSKPTAADQAKAREFVCTVTKSC